MNPLGHPLNEQVKMYTFFPSTSCFNQEKKIHNMHFCLSRSLLSLSFLLEYYQEEFFFRILQIILRARLGLLLKEAFLLISACSKNYFNYKEVEVFIRNPHCLLKKHIASASPESASKLFCPTLSKARLVVIKHF